MARELKVLPAEMYVAEVTIDYIGWGGKAHHYVELLGPFTTLPSAKGQATSKNRWRYGDTGTVTSKFFKGTMTWEEMK